MDVQVWAEPFCRRHYAGVLSGALLFRIFHLCLALGMALVVAFSTGGFWIVVVPAYTHPVVRYSNSALLLFQGSQPSQDQIWSTSAAVNSAFPDRVVPANIQVSQEDYLGDGNPTIIDFRALVTGVAPVNSVKAALQFTYFIDEGPVRLQMYCLAYLSATSKAPGGALDVDGELLLSQRTPLNAYVYSDQYWSPLLDLLPASNTTLVPQTSMLDFQDIIASYNGRNFTAVYNTEHQSWKAGPGNVFELNMRVRVPLNQLVVYRPTVLENLKYGWIQFLATYIAFWVGLRWLEGFGFAYGILGTRKRRDTQPTTQHF